MIESNYLYIQHTEKWYNDAQVLFNAIYEETENVDKYGEGKRREIQCLHCSQKKYVKYCG